jgi:hypothetical protein
MRVLDPFECLDRRAPARLGVAHDRKLELFEEHRPELLRRVDVERVPRQPVDLRLELGLDLGERFFGAIELGRVDDEPGELHPHAHVLHLEVIREELSVERWLELLPDGGGRIRELTGVFRDPPGGDGLPGLALLADATNGVFFG